MALPRLEFTMVKPNPDGTFDFTTADGRLTRGAPLTGALLYEDQFQTILVVNGRPYNAHPLRQCNRTWDSIQPDGSLKRERCPIFVLSGYMCDEHEAALRASATRVEAAKPRREPKERPSSIKWEEGELDSLIAELDFLDKKGQS